MTLTDVIHFARHEKNVFDKETKSLIVEVLR